MSNADQVEVYLWVLFAFGLGAVVGLEREIRGHEAGIRTNALVCAGAATFSLIGRDIGEAALPTVGDELRLDSQFVRCDLWQFEQALSEDRLDDAVALYTGPLLDGFHPADLADHPADD